MNPDFITIKRPREEGGFPDFNQPEPKKAKLNLENSQDPIMTTLVGFAANLRDDIKKTHPAFANNITACIDQFNLIAKNEVSNLSIFTNKIFEHLAFDKEKYKIWFAFCKAISTEMIQMSVKCADNTTLSLSIPKLIWFSFSDYFEIQWKWQMNNSGSTEITLDESESESGNKIITENLISFLNCLKNRSSENILSEENITDMMRLAEKYRLEWLLKECECFCIDRLPDQQQIDVVYQFLDFSIANKLPTLFEGCLHYFVERCGPNSELIEKYEDIAKKNGFLDLYMFCLSTKFPSFKFNTSYTEPRPIFNAMLHCIISTNDLEKESDINLFKDHVSTIKQILLNGCSWYTPSIELTIQEQSLHSMNNSYVDGIIHIDGIIDDIADGLKESKTITTLNITCMTEISKNEWIAKIPEIIGMNKTLKNLNFSTVNEFLIETDITEVALSLIGNTSISKMCLTLNIGLRGATAIAKVLKCNNNLNELQLNECHIGNSGAHAISMGLKENTGLKHLSMKTNNIGSSGFDDLSRVFYTNTTLLTLDLTRNPFEDVLEEEIGDDNTESVVLMKEIIDCGLLENTQRALRKLNRLNQF